MSEAGETIKWNTYLLYVKDWVSAHSSPDLLKERVAKMCDYYAELGKEWLKNK